MCTKFNLTPAVLSLLIPGSCGDKNEGQIKEGQVAQTVLVTNVTNSQNDEVFHYSGTIEADNTVDLGFGVPGRVTAVNAHYTLAYRLKLRFRR